MMASAAKPAPTITHRSRWRSHQVRPELLTFAASPNCFALLRLKIGDMAYPHCGRMTMTARKIPAPPSVVLSNLTKDWRSAFQGQPVCGLAILSGVSGAAVDPVHSAGTVVVQFGLFDSPLARSGVSDLPGAVLHPALIGYFKSIPGWKNARWSTAQRGCRSCGGLALPLAVPD
jgi:hypothetical protein